MVKRSILMTIAIFLSILILFCIFYLVNESLREENFDNSYEKNLNSTPEETLNFENPNSILSVVRPYLIPENMINPNIPFKTSQEKTGRIYIYKLPVNPTVFVFTSSAAIDCDGQITHECNINNDEYFQSVTSFPQSDGKPLNSALLPFFVLPESPNNAFDFVKNDIYGGEVGLIIYKNEMSYGVFGDESGRDMGNIIGEISYAMADSLKIDPHPSSGGVSGGVTYIIFTSPANIVTTIENHSQADIIGKNALSEMLLQLKK